MDAIRAALVVLTLLFVATPALAHVPSFPEDNTSPERALVVPDAAKSWSFYDSLAGGETRYYRLSLEEGQRLRVGTFTPSGGAFTPSVVLFSESSTGTDQVPPQVTVPAGMGAEVVEGEHPDSATYEPFAPSANYHTVSVDRTVEERGEYVLAVYEPQGRSGQVGVTVGYEEAFSPTEYLSVPFDLVRIHVWAGQHPLVVAAPWLVTVGAGVALLRARWREPRDGTWVRYALGGAALLVLGTGASALLQMGIALAATGPTAAALVTAVYVVVPVGCGGWLLGVALRDDLVVTPRTRVALVVAAGASLVTWAGFVVGPAAMLAVAVAPTRVTGSARRADEDAAGATE